MHLFRCNTIKAKLLLALLFFGLVPLFLISALSVHLIEGEMVFSVPDTEAALYSRLILIFLLVIASVLLTGLLLAKKFTDPLKTLMGMVQKIRAGDLSAHVDIGTDDELGELARAFNATTLQLKKSYASLEKAVEKKTHQLNEKIVKIDQEKVKNEAIVRSIGEGIIVTNEQGKTVIINRSARDILGLSAAAVLRKNAEATLRLQHPDGKRVARRNHPIHLALFKRQKTEAVYDHLRHDDSFLPLFCIVSPVLLDDKVIGAIMVFRDVTKEQEIDRMKNEFVSLVSHQLRTPLSAMKWFTEILLSGETGVLPAEQKEFVENIRQLNDRMITLVNSLLNISRIESGRMVLEPVMTDLPALVNEVVGTFRERLKEKRIRLTIKTPPDLAPFPLDAKLIREVYSNLLHNAIQYTPTGGTIRVLLSPGRHQVISKITDSGYGIPKKEQTKVFQKFYRGSNIGVVETDGNGLGLYLAKSIVESSGGTIGFKSVEDKGTTFSFSLPKKG